MEYLRPSYKDLETLDVDLSTKCNLRCRFCHLSEYVPRENAQFSIERFRHLLDTAPVSLKRLILFSKYEALTCRDFIPIFRLIKDRKFEEVYFSTNGILLTDEIIEEIVGHLTFLTISVTGFDRNEYLRNMSADRLETVERNIQKINDLKRLKATELPKLRISVVGMQDTVETFKDAVDFAVRFRISEGVQVSYFNSHRDDMDKLMPASDMDRFMRFYDEARAYADLMGVRLELQGGTPDQIDANVLPDLNHIYCALPFNRLSVQPDLNVYPCPVAYEPVGTLSTESLREIWEGPRLAKFRQGVNSVGKQNRECRECSYCRVKSPTSSAGNRLSEKQILWAGMKRKVVA